MTTRAKSSADFATRRQHFEDLRAAVEAYGLIPKSLVRVGSGYRVESPLGPRYLKRFAHSPAEAVFLYHGLEHLRAHGLPDVPRLHLTTSGAPYIAPDGELYYLQDWQDLAAVDLEDPGSLGAAVELLASLHAAGEGFEPPPDLAAVRNDYGSWLDKCVGRLRELYSFAELAEDNRRESKFDAKYAKASSFFARQAEEAVRRLSLLPLNDVAAKEREAGAYCHRDFTPSNLALDSRSRLQVVDFDNSAREIRLDDLAKFIRRAGALDLERTSFIIDRYAEASGKRLNEDDLGLLGAYLLFPTDFWAIGNSRFRKDRRRERSLRRVLRDGHAWTDFADGLRDLTPATGRRTTAPSTMPKPHQAPMSLPDGPALPAIPFAVVEAPPAAPLGLLRYDEPAGVGAQYSGGDDAYWGVSVPAPQAQPVAGDWHQPVPQDNFRTFELDELAELIPWYDWPAGSADWTDHEGEGRLTLDQPVHGPPEEPATSGLAEPAEDDAQAEPEAAEVEPEMVEAPSKTQEATESETTAEAEAAESEATAEAELAVHPQPELSERPAQSASPKTIVWGNWPKPRRGATGGGSNA